MATNREGETDGSRQGIYHDLKGRLLSKPGQVLPPAPSSPSKAEAHAISSLLVHPSLEAAFHILNDDLPSAHFLVRHMQAAPQYESMFLHGILHRIEGDYNNTRAWYRDVQDSEVFQSVWGKGGLEKALEFVREIEVWRKEKRGVRDPLNFEHLQEESKREISATIDFCESKFGTGKVEDASSIWVQDAKSSGKGRDMVIGGEGWRQF